jgi:Kef-type K+ transport system membrane component KefB/nucleotide-binding universal stress UspA family protein
MLQLLQLIDTSPIISFTIVLLVILTIPPIFEKIRLPGLIGLLVAGILLGPDGLGLLNSKSETMELFSDIGKIYLMFVAGLEIDLGEFRKTKNRSLTFGLATFLIPIIVGTSIGRFSSFGWNASILIGSLLASHTLLAYPIVNRLGVVQNQAVTITIGATIITDIGALLVLAICVSIHGGDFSAYSLIFQLVSLALYCLIVLFGFDWAGKEYFRRTGDEESNQFLFVLLAVFLASVGAQLINVDKIVGAFLAGLAVNDVVGRSPVEEKVVFVGSTLFIPFFFVNMGMLLSFSGLVSSFTTHLILTLMIVGGLIGSKFLAALFTKIVYHYNWDETLTMWSLSIPQVAATLAATLAGVNVGVLDNSVFNSVIVLMLVTSILGPILTAKFACKISPLNANLPSKVIKENITDNSRLEPDKKFTVIISIYNPYSAVYLTEMAALLARNKSGIIMPLSVAKAHLQMDEPQLEMALKQSDRLLKNALTVSDQFQVEARTLVRIDDNIANGITRTAKEQNADLIVMGWSPITSFQARLFGNVIDRVFWSSHCPVAVMRLLDDPINIHRVLVPIKNLTSQALETVKFAKLFATTNQAEITILHVCNSKTSHDDVSRFKIELQSYLEQTETSVSVTIKIIRYDDIAKVILKKAQTHDMVMLRSVRRRTAGGLAVSDVTNQVISELNCSIVLFGDTI